MLILSPSILAADMTKLGAEVDEIYNGGAEWVHFDVMDGNFVPNISVGIPVLKSLRQNKKLFLDVHLMIERPGRYIRAFLDSGADMITMHIESDTEQSILDACAQIHAAGKLCGVTLKPGTPAEALRGVLDAVDMVLVMTVEPGFGGQKFMADQLDKIRTLRSYYDACGKQDFLIEVDGGVDAQTAPLVIEAGANVLVAGSAVFGKPDRAEAIREIRNSKAEH